MQTAKEFETELLLNFLDLLENNKKVEAISSFESIDSLSLADIENSLLTRSLNRLFRIDDSELTLFFLSRIKEDARTETFKTRLVTDAINLRAYDSILALLNPPLSFDVNLQDVFTAVAKRAYTHAPLDEKRCERYVKERRLISYLIKSQKLNGLENEALGEFILWAIDTDDGLNIRNFALSITSEKRIKATRKNVWEENPEREKYEGLVKAYLTFGKSLGDVEIISPLLRRYPKEDKLSVARALNSIYLTKINVSVEIKNTDGSIERKYYDDPRLLSISTAKEKTSSPKMTSAKCEEVKAGHTSDLSPKTQDVISPSHLNLGTTYKSPAS